MNVTIAGPTGLGQMMGLAFLVLLLASASSAAAQMPSDSPEAFQSNQSSSALSSPASGITAPIAIGSHACAGFYPPIAMRLNQQGTTIVRVTLSSQGTVADVRIKATSGHEALDAASVRCASTWLYRPATKDGTPIAAITERAIHWMLANGTAPPPVPFLPSGPPVGWEPENSFPYLAGDLASYKLSRAPTAEQYLSAKAYWNVSDLGDFVAKIDANLQSIKTLRILREERTTVCDGTSASEIEFSEPGLVSTDPSRVHFVEQVSTVKNGWAYVSTYIRPTESPKRPDAEQWLRAFCISPG